MKKNCIKRLTDVKVAQLNGTSARNIHQTYKKAKSNKYITLSEDDVKMKHQQYCIMRLGATCIEYDIDEETLLRLISNEKDKTNK